MGCSYSNNKIAPTNKDNKANLERYMARLDGIKGMIELKSTKISFARYLNSLPMQHQYTTSKDLPGINELDSYFFDMFAGYFQDAYKNNLSLYSIIPTSIFTYLMTDKAKPKIIVLVLLHIFPKFIESQHQEIIKEDHLHKSKVYSIHMMTDDHHQNNNHHPANSYRSFIQSISTTFSSKLSTSLNSLIYALDHIKTPMIICSTEHTQLESFPIVYVSPSFTMLTGYFSHEVIGRNPRFLQSGGKSEPEAINNITQSLTKIKECQVVMTNYTKEGLPFMNLLTLIPIKDEHDQFIFVVGLLFDVTKPEIRLKKQLEIQAILPLIPKMVFSDNIYQEEDSFYL